MRVRDSKERFPVPRVPILPILSAHSFGRQATSIPSVAEAGVRIEVRRGAAAIALALRHGQVGAGDEVLVPAFNCASMVEPILAVSATPILYRIQEDLAVDLNDIQTRLTARARAILVPHYFGFMQDIPVIRRFCDAHKLMLIEDCAHAFFGQVNGHPVGWYGDYAIASVRKFFPVVDGGYLISSRRSLGDLQLGRRSWRYDMRVAASLVESAAKRWTRKRAYRASPPSLRQWAVPQMCEGEALQSVSPGDGQPGTYQYKHVDPASFDRPMSRASRTVVRVTATERTVMLRRANFLELLDGMRNVRTVRSLFERLPDDVVPYMFPLLIKDSDKLFAELKCAGVPIWRWDSMTIWRGREFVCPNSEHYSRHLLQLPCHQELRRDEIGWMISTIKERAA